jgi:hypothetical protein
MEGHGVYNRSSRVQAAGLSPAVPLFEHAARTVDLPVTPQPIVIADYGSSQGHNSRGPLAVAISVLRERVGSELGMFVSQVIQGRLLSSGDVELIRRLIAAHPHWSRNRLSIAVSEQFNWRTANGQLKDMSARLLLAKLAQSGLIQLPPRQRRGGRQRLRVLSEPELFWLASQSVQPIESPLEALRPLEVLLIEARTKARQKIPRNDVVVDGEALSLIYEIPTQAKQGRVRHLAKNLVGRPMR